MTWLLSILGIGGIGAALFFIPGALPAVIAALSALLGLVRRNPWPCAVIALCALSAWLWTGKRAAIAERKAALTELAAVIDAGKRATAAQKAENARIQSAFQGAADNAERNHDTALADARDSTSAFIARNRVRACPSSPGRSDRTAQAGGAQLPQTAAADTELVAVTQSDVTICGDLYAYSKAAYDWAADLRARGLAE